MRVALSERFDERDVNVVVEPWILDRHIVQIALRALLTNRLQALLDFAPQPLLDACHPFTDLGIGQHCSPSFRVQAVEILLDDLLICLLYTSPSPRGQAEISYAVFCLKKKN